MFNKILIANHGDCTLSAAGDLDTESAHVLQDSDRQPW